MLRPILFALLLAAASPVAAGSPIVEAVAAREGADGWRFDVTVSHGDTGWDHYADAWRIESMDGQELGVRILMHPHVTEQPFTRSLSGVPVPDGAREVVVRARDSVHGWGAPYVVTLR